MKKYLIILLIIVITIICTICIKDWFFASNTFSPTIYQSSVNYDNISDEASLQYQGLKVTLKDIFQDEFNKEQLTSLGIDDNTADKIISSYSGENKLNILVEVSNQNNTGISEVNFDYLIYDNAGNILMTPIAYTIQNSKMNKFIKYFVEREYNSKNIREFNNHKLEYGGTSSSIYNSGNDNSKLMLLTSYSSEEQTNLDLSKIHILLINPTYKDSKTSNSYNLDNTIFEFIVEN